MPVLFGDRRQVTVTRLVNRRELVLLYVVSCYSKFQIRDCSFSSLSCSGPYDRLGHNTGVRNMLSKYLNFYYYEHLQLYSHLYI